MRILKRIVAGVVIVLAALVAVAFFLPREAQVTRSVDIAAPPSVIFPIASHLRRFSEWSPWLDVKILFRTVFTVLSKQNAY